MSTILKRSHRDHGAHDRETDDQQSVESVLDNQAVKNAESGIEANGHHPDDSLLWKRRLVVVGDERSLGFGVLESQCHRMQ